MSVMARHREMSDRLIRHFGDGGTVTLRRRHTLKIQRRGEPSGSLLVSGAHSAGVATLTLRADLLTGKLRTGHVVTVAGTPYTATADAEASGNTIAVPITPVLAAPAVDGAAATVTTAHVDYSFSAFRTRADVEDADTGERETRRALHLAHRSDCTPEPGDLVVIDGTAKAITAIETVNPGGGAVRYRLILGAA